MTATHLVTGAFGYTGRYITRLLLENRLRVRTLTRSPGREHPFAERVETFPLDFEQPQLLRRALEGVSVFYNTYWVRFSKRGFRQSEAVRNTRRLFEAAREVGVERVVHVSITNPAQDSPYEYFRWKAILEDDLRETGLPHSILRPAVIFGPEDILINNIAWMLRRFPVFGLFGDGRYRLQPIHVGDFAELAVREAGCSGCRCLDAVGPEVFEYRELVRSIADAIGIRRRLVRLPRAAGLALSFLVGLAVRDVVLTRQEIGALMDDLLVGDGSFQGRIALSQWVRENAADVGKRYASELARRRNRELAYARL